MKYVDKDAHFRQSLLEDSQILHSMEKLCEAVSLTKMIKLDLHHTADQSYFEVHVNVWLLVSGSNRNTWTQIPQIQCWKDVKSFKSCSTV